MSTKAIREALDDLAAYASRGGFVEANLRKALAELEAIEKAARTLDVWSDEPAQERSVAMNRDAGEAFGLMAIIANQETKR